jgi:hypothetical protein
MCILPSLLTCFALHFPLLTRQSPTIDLAQLQIPLLDNSIGLTGCACLQGSFSAADTSLPRTRNPAKMLLPKLSVVTLHRHPNSFIGVEAIWLISSYRATRPTCPLLCEDVASLA